jgi:hypothetical protein
MPRPTRLALTYTLLFWLLAACLPGGRVTSAPTFRLVPEGSGLTHLDVVAPGGPSATFRLVMDVADPATAGLRLVSLEGTLFLDDVRAGSVTLPSPAELPPRGRARLALDVGLESDAFPALRTVFVDALAGAAVPYRFEAEVAVEVAGTRQTFPRATLLAGSVVSPARVTAPRLTLDRAASGVRSVGFDRVVIDLGLSLHNDGPVGVQVRGPDLRLGLGGRDVATVHLPITRLAPGEAASLAQEIVLNPVQLGPAIVAELTRLAAGQAGGVELSLRGAWELEVPGVLTRTTAVDDLLRARLE